MELEFAIKLHNNNYKAHYACLDKVRQQLHQNGSVKNVAYCAYSKKRGFSKFCMVKFFS